MALLEDPQFVDSPPPRGKCGPRNPALVALADKLRAHPGQWALIDESTTNTSNYKTRLGAQFEVTARRSDNGSRVYARYVGEAGE